MTRPHTSLFAEHVAPFVGGLLGNVVVFGLTLISIDYGVSLVAQTDALSSPETWRRLALLAMVVLFSTYNTVAYTVQLDMYKADGPQFTPYRGTEPALWRVVVLLLIDLGQVGLTAAMFAALAVGAGESLADPVGPGRTGLIFAMLATWHALIFLWYAVWADDAEFPVRHLGLGVVAGVAAALFLVLRFGRLDEAAPALLPAMHWAAPAYLAGLITVLFAGSLPATLRRTLLGRPRTVA